MFQRLRMIIGISLLWLALSMIFDGINALALPSMLAEVVGDHNRATVLGFLTFAGLLAGMLVQPVAGALSDRLRPRGGRLGFIGLGVVLVLVSLFLFAQFSQLTGIFFGYLTVQVALAVVQAGQQGLIPDLTPEQSRGLASGLKSFMDIAGAMFGFVLLGELIGNGQFRLALLVIAVALVAGYLLTIIMVPEARKKPKTTGLRAKPFSLGQVFRLDFKRHSAFTRLVLARFLFLLATYAIGRFLLYFVADRLGINTSQAAEQAGTLLAGLALTTVLAAPFTGWAADRIGRLPVMLAGSLLSAFGAILLIWANGTGQMLAYGAMMSVGSAAFASANWAKTADLAPSDEAARFFGLANFGTAGAAAAAGLFGPLIDWINRVSPGLGYPALFFSAGLIFIASTAPIIGLSESKKLAGSSTVSLSSSQQPSSLGGSDSLDE